MARKLVSIRKIKHIIQMENSNNLELCLIDGWGVVAKKGQFHQGDFALYFEIDSFLPIKPEYEFLRKTSYRKLWDGSEGFRIKTIRLRGQLSQGLLLPIDPMLLETLDQEVLFEDQDLTAHFGVKLWEVPVSVSLSGKVKGQFPSFIPKTDQERVQNLVEDFEYLQKYKYEITEKMDGTSCTIYWKDGEFGVCSRNLEMQLDDGNVYSTIAKKYGLLEKLNALAKNIAIQGEIVGPGIQSNHYKLPEVKFLVFDIYDITTGKYLGVFERLKILGTLGLENVPLVGINSSLEGLEGQDIDKLLLSSEGQSNFNGVPREGIVYKGMSGHPSFKCISNQYLLDE